MRGASIRGEIPAGRIISFGSSAAGTSSACSPAAITSAWLISPSRHHRVPHLHVRSAVARAGSLPCAAIRRSVVWRVRREGAPAAKLCCRAGGICSFSRPATVCTASTRGRPECRKRHQLVCSALLFSFASAAAAYGPRGLQEER